MEKLKKILASILCINILLSGSPVLLFAATPTPPAQSNITGVTPQSGVYNITPESISSETGIRSYTDFTLAQGDTANLIFSPEYNKFLNFVDNQVSIWGTLNTTNSNGALTNGNAVFITPSGIIIGASGVLNVGSVSLISSSAEAIDAYKTEQSEDNYDKLISGANGNVAIYGKITASDTVEVYANDITASGAQLITGKEVFDSLVNNSAQNATNVTVRNGKVILSAKSNITQEPAQDVDSISTVTVENSTITSGEITIASESNITVESDIISGGTPLNDTVANATVSIDSSTISGSKVSVTAAGNYELKTGKLDATKVKLNSSTFYNLLDKGKKKLDFSLDSMAEYGFSKIGSLLLSQLEKTLGTSSTAEVTLKDSKVESSGDLSVSTAAKSNTKIEKLDTTNVLGTGEMVDAVLLSLGSTTKSGVSITGSNLSAGGNLDTNALSNNILEVSMSTDVKTKRAFTVPYLNTRIKVDTTVTIDKSVLTGKQTGIQTFSYENMKVSGAADAQVGTTSFQGSGGAVVISFATSDVNNTIDIKNESEVKSTDGDLSIQALNAGVYSSTGSAKTSKAKKEGGEKGDDPGTEAASSNVFKAGGSFVFSDINTKLNVNITNSTVDSAGKLQIRSYLYNMSVNNSSTKNTAKDTEAKLSAGVALILSDVDNSSNVTITDSTLNSKDSMKIDAVTELPGIKGEIKIGTDQINVKFNLTTGADDKFDPDADINFKIKDIWSKPTKTDLKPVFQLKGFFNNVAGAYTQSETAGAEASIVIDKVSNDTNVVITKSALTSKTADIAVNAVNSMDYADGAGFSRPKIDMKKPSTLSNIWKVEDEGGPGAGGAILVQNFENTSTVKVDNESTLSAENGNIELNAASEQLYMDFTKLATKAANVDIVGATNVQNIGGTVSVEVSNKTTINAKDIRINAGKATAELVAQKDDGGDDVSKTGIKFADRRDVNDHVTAIDFTGAYADAKEGGGKTVDVAIGASVNVKKVDRTVQALVDDSTLVASSGNVDVNAQSKTYMFDLVMAGAVNSEETSAKKNNKVKAKEDDKDWQELTEEADSPAAEEDSEAAPNPVEADVKDAVSDEGDKDDGEAPAPTPDDGSESENDSENVDDKDNAAPAANAAANPANRTNWSLAAAGSVGVFIDKNDIKATVKDSKLTASSGEINVTSAYRTVSVLASGGVSDSSTIGFGAAVNLYFREGETGALVDNSELVSTKNSVSSEEKSTTVNVAAGLVKSDSSSNFAMGGSFAYNTYKPVIKAEVANGSKITGTTDIDAQGSILNVDIAGGVEITTQGKDSSSFQVASSFAGTMDYFNSDIVAQVDGSEISGAETVTVDSKDDVQLVAVSAGVGVTTAPVEGQAKLDGSLSIVYANNNINALINNTNAEASGDISVTALNNAEIFNLDGVIDYSAAKSGVGANGAVNINIQKNNVSAGITSDTNEKKTVASTDGKLSIVADSNEKLNIINAAAAIGKSTSMLASVVSVGIVRNTVSAIGNGSLSSKTGVDIVAEDNTFVLSRGGTLAGVVSGQKSAGLAVSVNIDKMYKNVSASLANANVNTRGDVNVKAISVDGMGAGKDTDLDNLDDILKDAESEKPKGDGLNRDFTEWDMFYNLAGASDSFLTLAGAFSLKIVKNNISATVDNSSVSSENLTVAADQSTSKNLIAGSLSATGGRAAVGGQLIRPTDSSTIRAEVKNKTVVSVGEEGKLNITATENKNDKTILVAGAVSNNVGISANGLFNLNKSKLTAIMNDSTLRYGSLNINSEEKINGLRIIVAAGGANQGESLALNVAINKYKQITEALLYNSTLTSNAAYVDVNAKNTIKTGDYLLGLGFTMQGASEGVVGIRNDYTNKTYARIGNSSLNNNFDINVKALSQMVTDNRSLVAVGAFQGASISANIIINDDDSSSLAEIKDSDIKNTGDIVIAVNEDENGNAVKDKIDNKVFAFGFTFQGAQVAANVVLNHYHNDATAILNINTTDAKAVTTNNLTVKAFSDRDINTTSVMVGANFMGAALNLNLVKDDIESVTRAAVFSLAPTQIIKVRHDIAVNASDNSLVTNKLGTVGGGAISGVPIANVKLHYDNGLSLAEITGGTVSAKDVTVNQNLVFGYNQVSVGTAIGGLTIAGDVNVLRFGADSGYTDLEKHSKIEETVNQSNDIINKAGIADTPETHSENGSIARINSNLDSNGSVKVDSKVVYKGYDSDKLKITNVNVDVGAIGAGVGVLSFKQNTENTAQVSGTLVAKTLDVNASYKDDVDIDSVKVEISGIHVSGGSSAYNNNSKTAAIIKDADVTVDGHVNVVSRLDSRASTSGTDVSLKFGDIGVAGYELVGNSKTRAYVDSSAVKATDLNLKATGSAEYSGKLVVVAVSGIGMGFTSTKANNDTSFSAQFITDSENGRLNVDVQNLNILSGYDKMSVLTQNNAVRISGFDIASTDAKANMSARFYSGFGKDNVIANGVVKVSGTTTIETGKKLGSDIITSDAKIHGVEVSVIGVNVGTTARAENNVLSNTYFNLSDNVNEGFITGNLNVNAYLEASTSAKSSDTAVNLGGVSSLSVETDSKSQLNIVLKGVNTINGEAVVNANHINDVKTDLSSFSAGILGNVTIDKIESVLSASTKGEFSGTLKHNKFTAIFKTERNGTLNLSTSGGGGVHVGSATAKNSITGSSDVIFKGMKTGDAANGDFLLTNYSDTTIDSISHSSSGGFIAVQNDGKYLTLDTSSSVVLDGVKIGTDKNPIGSFSIDVKNNELVKDSSSNKGGGFVSVSSDSSDNTYTSNALIEVTNKSEIYSSGFNLSSTTDIRTDTDDYVKYRTSADGFITASGVYVKNTLNQNNKVNIIDSKLEATGLGVISVAPTFQFQQDGGAGGDGLSAWPKADTRLTSNNDSQVFVDINSTVKGEILEFKFDVNGTLRSYAHVKARDAYSEPKSYSSVDLNVNNKLSVQGLVWSTMFLDIEFMKDSKIDISQEAFTQHNAVAPKTHQDGHATKTINNTLDVWKNEGQEITGTLKTDRDMNISFYNASGSISSNNHYKKVYYILFGKTKKGSDTSNTNSIYNPRFILNGDVVAGKGEDKVLYINADGTVDQSKSFGFADGEYEIVNNPDYTGFELKQQRLDYLEKSIETVDAEIDQLNSRMSEIDEEQLQINEANTNYQKFTDEFNKRTASEGDITIDEFKNVLNYTKDDIKALVGQLYKDDVMKAILEQFDSFEDLNESKIREIINNMGSLSQQEKDAYINGFVQASEKVEVLDFESGYKDLNFSMYGYRKDGKVVLGLTSNGEGGYEEIDAMHATLDRINDISNRLAAEKADSLDIRDENVRVRGILEDALVESRLKTEEQYALEYNPYAYVFKDMYLYGASHVNVEGLTGKKDARFDAAIETVNDRPQFKIKQPGGLRVINYSDYSLVFGSIDITDKDGQKAVQAVIEKFKDIDLSKLREVESLTSALVINGEDRGTGDFPQNLTIADKKDPTVVGVTIQSLRNEANPLYVGPEDHSVDYTGNITIKGNLTSDDKPVKIFAQSGNIIINGLNDQPNRLTDINAPQGVIQIGGIKDENTGRVSLSLGSTEKITAGKGIVFIADDITLDATITSGITQHTFKLPLVLSKSGLEYDPTTGEYDLIPHIEGNNIDAILVSEDGKNEKIYLFDIVNYQGYVKFKQPYRTEKEYLEPGEIKGQAVINIYHGFGNINIYENNYILESRYPLILGDILNVSDTYENVTVLSSFHPSIPIKIYNIYLNGTLATDSESGYLTNLVVNAENDGRADTHIETIGRGIHIENSIYNGMFVDSTGYFNDNLSADSIAHDLTLVDERSMINVNAPVVGSGTVTVTTAKRSDLNITKNGSIDVPIAVIWDSKTNDEPIEARNVSVNSMALITYSKIIDVENITVKNNANFVTSGKTLVVNNANIRRESVAPVKMYTAVKGAFDLSVNESNIAETDAPVVYSFGNVLVKNPLGYHTFETIALSKASEMTEETYTKSRTPHIRLSYEKKILDEEVELIKEVNENSY